MTSTTENKNLPTPWLDVAAKLATIAIAILGLIGAFIATLHFVIQVDVGPRFTALEIRLADFEQITAQRFDAVEQRLDTLEQRFDTVDQRLDGMDQRLDGMDQRLARIETLLTKQNQP